MKAAIPDGDQTLLGYHSRGKSSSALSYGRDSLAGPLRSLAQVLSDIRAGRFRPDLARSGRWQTAASSSTTSVEPASSQPEPVPAQLSSDSDSSSDLESEGSSGDDVQSTKRQSQSSPSSRE